jgi:hypothetical protein
MTSEQQLRDRIEELEDLLGLKSDRLALMRSALGLTSTEAKMVSFLSRRQLASLSEIYDALYCERSECDQPNPRSVSSIIHQARRKLDKFGISIQTQFASGYFLSKQDKEKLEAIMAAQDEMTTRYAWRRAPAFSSTRPLGQVSQPPLRVRAPHFARVPNARPNAESGAHEKYGPANNSQARTPVEKQSKH